MHINILYDMHKSYLYWPFIVFFRTYIAQKRQQYRQKLDLHIMTTNTYTNKSLNVRHYINSKPNMQTKLKKLAKSGKNFIYNVNLVLLLAQLLHLINFLPPFA